MTLNEILDSRITDDEMLSVRVMNVLTANNIWTYRDLVKWDRLQLLKLRNMGKNSARELQNRMQALGLSFSPQPTQQKDKEPQKTMRDELAIEGLRALMQRDPYSMTWDEFADEAYAIADAMLKAREQ